MKKILSLALLLGIAGSNLFAQTAISDSLQPKASAEVDYAKRIISALSAHTMNGRGYAKNADKDAATFIFKEFESIGVGAVGSSYWKKFTVPVNTFPGMMNVSLGNNILFPGLDFMVDASSAPLTGTFKVVHISRKEMGDNLVVLDKIRDANNLYGVLLIDNSSREDEKPEQTARINQMMEKIKTEAKINLKGVLIYQPGTKINWRTSSVQNPRAIIYITGEMEDISKVKEAKLSIEATFSPAYETQNVVGMLKGALKPDSFIVIASHYDHLGLMGKDVAFPGANNGASGVAMMLALAKHYRLIMPNISVLFVAFGGSELNKAGAQEFIKNPPVPLSRVKFMVHLDYMGQGYDGLQVANGTRYPALMRTLQSTNAKYKLLSEVKPIQLRPNMNEQNLFNESSVSGIFMYSLKLSGRNLDDTADVLPLTKFAETQNLLIRFLETIR